MKILELFAGSRSFGRKCEAAGLEVFSIDWTPYEGVHLVKDIHTLTIEELPFIPDVLWASPDCATYSVIGFFQHRDGIKPISDYAKKCDNVNERLIKFIKQLLQLNPAMLYFIENPRGLLRKMPFMRELPVKTVWYCQYGDTRAKPTDIFTNSKIWKPRKPCYNGNLNCHHEKSPRGSWNTGTRGKKNAYERSKIPDPLCNEILKSIIYLQPNQHINTMAKQLSLFYKHLEITHDLYTLEYMKDGEPVIETFNGEFAYQKAVIKATELKINGFICYPLTRSRQFIVDGVLRKRGPKPKHKPTDNRNNTFYELKPANTMEAVKIAI